MDLRNRRSFPALAGVLLVGSLVAACSTSNSGTGSTTSNPDRSRGLCTLITPAEVEAITGSAVGTPRSVLQGDTTDCTYSAGNASHSVLIRYVIPANAASFAGDERSVASQGKQVTAVPGLGDQAFAVSETVGGTTKNSVVARKGTTMVLVSGTATGAQVNELATLALDRAG